MEIVKWIIEHLVIVGQVAAVVILLGLVLAPRTPLGRWVRRMIERRAVIYSAVVAWAAMLGSLFYSEIAGYSPCVLCWYQRIFMYAMAFLLLTAVARKERVILIYTRVLSVIGGLIALFHYYEQFTMNAIVPCGVVGYSASCTDHFVMGYGYITIPLMSFTAFLLIFLLSFAYRKVTVEG